MTGDITSVTVRADGWSADVVVSGFTTGAAYAYGLGANNDPAAAKVAFTVVSLGFDAAGNATTVTRTVYGVATVRKVYPNQTAFDETGGGNLTFRMALSDAIYAKDNTGAGNSGTAPTVTIAASLVNNAGGGAQNSNAATGLAVTNNSTLAYPKVIGHFAIEDRRPVNGTTPVEVFVAHKYGRNSSPVACVIIKATGASSSTVKTSSPVTAMAKSARADSLPVFVASLDISTSGGFTRGEVVNVNFKAYPWIGDSGATLDSNTDAGPKLRDLHDLHWTVMDKMIAVVDGVGGGTPTASTSQATADANPFATWDAARTGIAAANNSAYGLNRLDGGEVQLKAGTYTYAKGSQASTNGYFTTTRHSSATRAQVILAQSSADYQYAYMRLLNITVTRSSGTFLFYAASGNVFVMEGVNLTDTYGGWYSGDDGTYNSDLEFLDCVSTNNALVKGGNDGMARLVRNYTLTVTTENNNPAVGTAACVLGLHGSGGSHDIWGVNPNAANSNILIGYCTYYSLTDAYLINSSGNAFTGLALVQNLIERLHVTSTPLAELSAASHTNVVLLGNSFPGQRFNHENDIDSPYTNVTFTNFVGRQNVFNARGDHRADVRDTDASMIGTWAVGYSVGWSDNHNEGLSYTGDSDFYGIRSNFTPASTAISPSVAAGYTSDKSYGGNNAGAGNYMPALGSVLLNRIPAGAAAFPYDINGVAIPNDGTGSIGAVQRPVSYLQNLWFAAR